ncbi:MAG: hypothetical protein J5382_10440 [Bacteroidales bacterium]|nr:hypothetical protein [Bacteroidales bacterium]
MFIKLLDNTDKDLLVQSILCGIRDLAEIRDRSKEWGTGTMTIQDRIDRLQRILQEVTDG